MGALFTLAMNLVWLFSFAFLLWVGRIWGLLGEPPSIVNLNCFRHKIRRLFNLGIDLVGLSAGELVSLGGIAAGVGREPALRALFRLELLAANNCLLDHSGSHHTTFGRSIGLGSLKQKRVTYHLCDYLL